MKKILTTIDFTWSISTIGPILILLTTLCVGLFVGTHGISYREVMVVGALAIISIAIILGDKGIWFGYIGWIFMFGLGHRTIRFTSVILPASGILRPQTQDIVLHPLLLLIIALLILVIQRIAIFNHKPVQQAIPRIVWPFSLFWIWGLLVGIANQLPLDDMLITNLFNFVILIPIFIISDYVIREPKHLKFSIVAFFAVATYIAAFGSAEFSIPGFSSIVPGLEVGAVQAVDPSGFHRAGFAFWGHASAIFISLMALPFIAVLFDWYKNMFSRLILGISCIAIVYGLYIAGWRSMWAASIILIIILAIMKRSWKAVVIVVVVISIIYVAMPPEARARFQTFTDAMEGDFAETDGSSVHRLSRAETALKQAEDNPLGLGWGASGWVHSDFIQLAADTGIASAIIFIIWYLSTLIRLGWVCWKTSDNLRLGLFGSFFVVGVLFLTQPMYIQTQTVAPIWFVWALAHISLSQNKGALINALSKT